MGIQEFNILDKFRESNFINTVVIFEYEEEAKNETIKSMEYSIRPLKGNSSSNSSPFAAYNKDSKKVVFAEEMQRGNGSTEYDIFGFDGTKDIVCLDCMAGLGNEVPLVLISGKKVRKHFRHEGGKLPGGAGRHGETADHIYGKYLVSKWLEDQLSVVPGSVSQEYWSEESNLRLDVTAELADGTRMAFEVQRRPLSNDDWERRHGKNERDGVKDVWLWDSAVTLPRMTDNPAGNLVFDIANKEIGLHLAVNYSAMPRLRVSAGTPLESAWFMHPSRLPYHPSPTHYVSAPLSDWMLEEDGSVTPPQGLQRYLDGEAWVRPVPQPAKLTETTTPSHYQTQRKYRADSQHGVDRKPEKEITVEDQLSPRERTVLDAKRVRMVNACQWWLDNTPRGKQEKIDRQQRLENLREKWKRQDEYNVGFG